MELPRLLPCRDCFQHNGVVAVDALYFDAIGEVGVGVGEFAVVAGEFVAESVDEEFGRADDKGLEGETEAGGVVHTREFQRLRLQVG